VTTDLSITECLGRVHEKAAGSRIGKKRPNRFTFEPLMGNDERLKKKKKIKVNHKCSHLVRGGGGMAKLS